MTRNHEPNTRQHLLSSLRWIWPALAIAAGLYLLLAPSTPTTVVDSTAHAASDRSEIKQVSLSWEDAPHSTRNIEEIRVGDRLRALRPAPGSGCVFGFRLLQAAATGDVAEEERCPVAAELSVDVPTESVRVESPRELSRHRSRIDPNVVDSVRARVRESRHPIKSKINGPSTLDVCVMA